MKKIIKTSKKNAKIPKKSMPKIKLKALNTRVIKSLGTQRNYRACLSLYKNWCVTNEVPSNEQSSLKFLNFYLEEKSEVYQQKTLCLHRMSLNASYHKKLKFVKSELETIVAARDYKFCEILEIIKNISAQNALAILICYFSGLRAHELATLQRQDEGSRSSTRKWSDSLFDFEDYYVIYIVTGKGGLRRYVAIPIELAEIIEERRFKLPQKVIDRGIYYHRNYDLGFGKALSQCFSRSSIKHLGWSTGLHGTRHSYAKNRIKKLLDCHYPLYEAKLIVSQELGHFRPEIVNCYLR
jgi:integrase